MSKKALGKGLQALFNHSTLDSPRDLVGEVQEIDLDKIRPGRFQPRIKFDPQKLEELAASIKNHGVVQPVVVRRVENGTFELVAGERRWRACQLIGLSKIPALIKDFSDREAGEIALIENLQREELDPIEEAQAYKKLQDEFGLKQDDIAERVGKSRPAIANSLRLLSLPDFVKKLISAGKLSAGHGRALLSLDQNIISPAFVEEIIRKQISVRDLEKSIKKKSEITSSEKKQGLSFAGIDPEINDLEDRMRRILGTKVKINGSLQKGKIEIEYYGADDLQRITDVIFNWENESE